MDIVRSKKGVPIRLTEERWFHITEEHSEMAGYYYKEKKIMAVIDIKKIVNLTPELLGIPFKKVWVSYDEEADFFYLNFKKPSHADDSELTENDVIIRYEKGEIVGVTVLHASKR